jgi:Mn-containing catalase
MENKRVLLEGLLEEVKFKIDLLDYDYSYFKKFEKALKSIKKYFKENELDFEKSFGYSISSTKTSSFSNGESKQRQSVVARLKLDNFDERVKKAEKSIKDTKKDIQAIFEENGLEIFDLKYRENKPEELIFTIKL